MFTKKLFLAIVIGAFSPIFSMANVSYCFESQSASGKIVRLKLSIPNEAGVVGFVKYKDGSSEIEIMKVSEKVTSSKRQIPASVQSKWVEKTEARVTGNYFLTTTGANAGGLVYVRAKDKKRFQFFDDRQNPDLNCGWEQ